MKKFFLFFFCINPVLAFSGQLKNINPNSPLSLHGSIGSAKCEQKDEEILLTVNALNTNISCQVSFSPSQREMADKFCSKLSTASTVHCYADPNSFEIATLFVKYNGTNLQIQSQFDKDLMQDFVPSDLKNPRLLTTGSRHACVLTDTGVRCWGRNGEGQLNVPQDLGINVLELQAGYASTCAITRDKKLICWGQYNISTYEITSSPYVPPALSIKFTDPHGLDMSHDEGPCLINDKKIICFFDPGFMFNQLDPVYRRVFPTEIKDIKEMVNLCVLAESGAVRCMTWGSLPPSNPLKRGMLNNILQISYAGGHYCVLDMEGNVNCWGGYLTGGDLLDTTPPPGLKDVKKVVVGSQTYACAILSEGIQCWGKHVPLSALDKPVDEFSPDHSYACAISNGIVTCWGKLCP
jgi:hypothetical protein